MKINILWCLTFVIFNSCGHEPVKVVFPSTIHPEIEQYMQAYEYMAVVYVDSVTCTSCKFNSLTMWKHFEKNLKKNNTGVLFLIRNSDEQSVIEALKYNKLTFPFIFDKEGKFKAVNEIFKFVRDNVFVMDRNKNVVMAESPIENEQTWQMFLNRVKKK
ncbi:MAG: hypothetical protein LBT50_11880 [Prevotellaceae bacterium]|jgi:hypothetical protein|nr:hypothetical protein [Prevotellaceae bacterium]